MRFATTPASAPSFTDAFKRSFTAASLTFALLLSPAPAEESITTPKQQFGFDLGEDYHLANYRQMVEYWQKLARESGRMKVVEIGKTEEGRTMIMGVISSPENLARVDHYREIARRLSRAEGLTDQEARTLAGEGKVIVWVSGGLHASETLGSQQLMESVYQFVRGDAEMNRIFENVILLAVPANPDGIDFIGDWYMRNPEPAKREVSGYPRLYQKYVGHDNNRDFYAVTQSETKAMSRVMFRDWFPQIAYDHHQSGPPGTVMFAPPFRDPFNYHLDPRILSGIDALGAAMMNRFLAEGKPGVTVRSGTRYSTWFNGGLRSIGYYHNVISLLTETIGNPTPMDIPFKPALQLPRNDMLFPIEPQKWHLRQSIDYSVAANRAVLDYASRQRFELLWGMYAMGRDAIAMGNRDHWTPTPERAAKAEEAMKKSSEARPTTVAATKTKKKPAKPGSTPSDFERLFHASADRDPRGYILSRDQPDFQTATRFINTLMESGVRVHRATAAFEAFGHSYPAESYVVLCNQAYRAHVLDMFEPQHHPNDLQYPGGPPIPPYDLAGWTLAMQMNVRFDRVFDALIGPFEEIAGAAPLPPAQVKTMAGAAGYFFTCRENESYRVVNRLFAAGEKLSRLQQPVDADGAHYPAGTFFVAARPDLAESLEKLARETGVAFTGAAVSPEAASLRKVRVGLWDKYGGSMPSGWTRWVLERFEFPFELVFAPELDAGNLRQKFDVLVFVTGAIPSKKSSKVTSASADKSDSGEDKKATKMPAYLAEEFKSHFGDMSAEKTIPKLRAFLEEGGTVLTIGSSANLAHALQLPVEDQLTESKDGKAAPLPREKFYIPGSLVRARVDTTSPLAWGVDEQMDFMFLNSPVLRLLPSSSGKPKATALKRVAWYDSATPLRSGWALGQEHLKDGLALFEAPIGAGHLVVCGPEILFRGQSHGSFKFLFNTIVNAGNGAH